MDRAKSPGGFERALAIFSESGEADFRLIPSLDRAASIALPSGPGREPGACNVADLFVPPSALKKEKNRIYAAAARLVEGGELAYALDSLAALENRAQAFLGAPGRVEAPPRAALVFPRADLPSGMPFAMRRDLAQGAALPSWGGRVWLPLAPLVAELEEYARLVRDRVRSLLSEGGAEERGLMLGIGSLQHVALARDILAENPGAGERLGFFLDFNAYIANDLAYASLAALLPRLEFAYRYIEAPVGSAVDEGGRIAPIGPDFEAPLFQSLGCLMKHHVLGGACPEGCGRSWTAVFVDRERRYRALVEDCVTMVFRTNEGRKSSR